MVNRSFQSETDKKRYNAVFLVPLFGAIFSLPPIMNLFNYRALVFGVPLTFLYLLSVWTLMVGIAFIISHQLKRRAAQELLAQMQPPKNPEQNTGTQVAEEQL